MKRYLEAGRLNSPRGLKGELRFECWCDECDYYLLCFPEFDIASKENTVAEVEADI